jgi:hypothetical protein
MTQVDILNFIPAIYDAAFDPALWQTVLARCASLLDSHCATLLYSQSALAGDMRLEGAGDGAIVHGFDASAIDDYLAHFAETNMFAARSIEVPEGTIESDEDVMPRADFERTQFYNDFLLRRLGARSVLTTLLMRNRHRLVAMTFVGARRGAAGITRSTGGCSRRSPRTSGARMKSPSDCGCTKRRRRNWRTCPIARRTAC